MNGHIVAQSPPLTQAVPLTPSQLDGFPVSEAIEVAAQLVHGDICARTGSDMGWLQQTRRYRNSIRNSLVAIVIHAPEGKQ